MAYLPIYCDNHKSVMKDKWLNFTKWEQTMRILGLIEYFFSLLVLPAGGTMVTTVLFHGFILEAVRDPRLNG